MNPGQLKVFETVKKNQNVFITGSAGCGKSYTLNHIIEWANCANKQIAVTASTGCASYLIRGRTIHSYLGIGLAKKPADELANDVKSKKKYLVPKLKQLDILIIDEISMINSELLTKISDFLSLIRKTYTPFGGVQVILCGDFCQLPPVSGEYCFNAECWDEADIKTLELTEQMRQSKDESFKQILEELRWGVCSDETYIHLKSLNNPQYISDDIVPTVLYSMNVDVDKINTNEYNKLVDNGAETQTYSTRTPFNNTSINAWVDSYKIPKSVEFCVGSQVMLTWNINQDEGLINGSRGVITRLTRDGPCVKFTCGREIIIESYKLKSEEESDRLWVSFIPLKLAWATTIHKSQGITLDAIVVDLGNSIFEYGQAYTALSRVRDLKSVVIKDISQKSFKTHPDVIDFYKHT